MRNWNQTDEKEKKFCTGEKKTDLLCVGLCRYIEVFEEINLNCSYFYVTNFNVK